MATTKYNVVRIQTTAKTAKQTRRNDVDRHARLNGVTSVT